MVPSHQVKYSSNGGDEVVATVDGEVITRQEWMASMESRLRKRNITKFGE